MLEGLGRVRSCTQQARNVSHSSRGFPSLPEYVGSSADACLTWAEFQVLLLGEGRVLLWSCQLLCRAGLSQGRWRLAQPRKPWCTKAASCLVLSGFGCRLFCEQWGDCWRAFCHVLVFGFKDGSGTESLLTRLWPSDCSAKWIMRTTSASSSVETLKLGASQDFTNRDDFPQSRSHLLFSERFLTCTFNWHCYLQCNNSSVPFPHPKHPILCLPALFLPISSGEDTENGIKAGENAQQLTCILNKPATCPLVRQVEEEIGSW